MRIITIIGARPQFIKAAIVSYAIQQHNAQSSLPIEETILHTGQHYDYNMSQVFFDELQIPAPRWHLSCNGCTVTEMRDAIVPYIRGKADYVMVYGDTNSTLAGALAAEQCGIPIIHIEAGLRSYNNQMAEEYNRTETDRRSRYLFAPTHTAIENLRREGITKGVYHTGDVMQDATLFFTRQAEEHSEILQQSGIRDKEYYLATIHRAETTNDEEKLAHILSAFARITTPVILPLHPRTKGVINQSERLLSLVREATMLRIIESVSYLDMLVLERHAACILTDSGGVQKEAYFHRVPCITMREETEWVETTATGWNRLVGTDTERIVNAVKNLTMPETCISEYGDGHAADKIIAILCKNAY